jgi:uncharacterized membrane protein YcaP (DUF421 family)
MDLTYIFGGWHAVARIAFIAAGGFITLIVLLRVGGWRRLTQMNVFDFVVAVTLGSAFGRAITAREVGILDVFVAFAVLVGMQQAFAWLQRSSDGFGRFVRPPPVLVYHRGKVLDEALSATGLREIELLQAARREGLGSLAEAEALIVEPDGSVSVVLADKAGDGSAIRRLVEG